MINYLRRTWATVNLNNLDYNIREIQRMVKPGCEIMGVVKADAYGHGDAMVAKRLVANGINWFGVSNIEEALSLREKGIDKDILIFGDTPYSLARVLAAQHITQTVYSAEYARQLSQAAQEQGVVVDVHIKVDTGMGRIGFLCYDDIPAAADAVEAAVLLPSLNATGIFTHFSCADEVSQSSKDYTRLQYDRFIKVCDLLKARGITFRHRHCCNSGGLVCYPEMHLDMVRPGIILYGHTPSAEIADRIHFKPLMELKSVVSLVKEVDESRSISYGRIYTTPKARTLATVCLGYADGYTRSLSGRANMVVNGSLARVVGRVCMDQVVLDVTGIDVKPGDVVTVFGSDGQNTVTVEELAELTGSFNYEMICLVGRRVPRVYLEDGNEIAVVDYIRQRL
ncbi:alanine racemase [Acetanaerobacterium elongatum]|uniref:Alanine racemase n=1 Tax=Acetanaerobacterium elongatum TaxID=258515 RepID=A0A1G9XCI7_9FIRM|nr:alanine racemase [Acetanaerobacterium elongatum]SDM94448.1 alanine racemase [Acetanaerobacterium elongatum]